MVVAACALAVTADSATAVVQSVRAAVASLSAAEGPLASVVQHNGGPEVSVAPPQSPLTPGMAQWLAATAIGQLVPTAQVSAGATNAPTTPMAAISAGAVMR